eukprot:scaffold80780_cov75-Phaeocystis_antarctica.AAC.1
MYNAVRITVNSMQGQPSTHEPWGGTDSATLTMAALTRLYLLWRHLLGYTYYGGTYSATLTMAALTRLHLLWRAGAARAALPRARHARRGVVARAAPQRVSSWALVISVGARAAPQRGDGRCKPNPSPSHNPNPIPDPNPSPSPSPSPNPIPIPNPHPNPHPHPHPNPNPNPTRWRRCGTAARWSSRPPPSASTRTLRTATQRRASTSPCSTARSARYDGRGARRSAAASAAVRRRPSESESV